MKQGVTEVLHAATTPSVAGATYGPMVHGIAHLLEAGEASGDLRPGIDADDLLLLIGFLWRIEPGPDAEGRGNRLLDLIMAGLRAGSEVPADSGAKKKRA